MKHQFEIRKHPIYSAPGIQSGVGIWAKCSLCEHEYEVTNLSDEPFDSGLFAECRECPDEEADAFDAIGQKMQEILG